MQNAARGWGLVLGSGFLPLGDLQKPPERGPWQPALGVPPELEGWAGWPPEVPSSLVL